MTAPKTPEPSVLPSLRRSDNPAFTHVFTPWIADGYAIPGLPDAGLGDGRVLLFTNVNVALSEHEWTVISTNHGEFEAMRADCGAGCRCAAEIRPVNAAPLLTSAVVPGRERIAVICSDEGIEIMKEIFDVLLDRENVSVEEAEAAIGPYGDTAVGLYERFIAPAIDLLEDYLTETD